MIDWDHVADIAKVSGILIAAIYAGLRGRGWIMRKSSQDGVAIATDAAEVSIIQRYANEAREARERADRAFEERNAAVSELGSLRQQVASLMEHKVDCERRLADLERRMDRREQQ